MLGRITVTIGRRSGDLVQVPPQLYSLLNLLNFIKYNQPYQVSLLVFFFYLSIPSLIFPMFIFLKKSCPSLSLGQFIFRHFKPILLEFNKLLKLMVNNRQLLFGFSTLLKQYILLYYVYENN